MVQGHNFASGPGNDNGLSADFFLIYLLIFIKFHWGGID